MPHKEYFGFVFDFGLPSILSLKLIQNRLK